MRPADLAATMARAAGATLSRRASFGLPFALLPAAARAQGWRPAQQVRIVVPAAAGGTTDIMGRLLAAHLQQRWGVSAVADNRTGAGGLIGSLEVVRARPDGQTLLLGNIGPQAIAYSLFRDMPYRPDQLLPVSGMIRAPNALVVHPSVPARNVAEFVDHLRAHPGRLSYGSPGVGQSPHLSAVWFCQLTGTTAIHVPYRGSAPALLELVAGTNQFMLDNLTTAIEPVRAGTVRALAVTSAERSPQLPDVPALRETLPELSAYEVNTWFGAFLPVGVPAPVLAAYSEAIAGLLQTPETRRRFAQMGGIPHDTTPEAYAAFVNAEIAKWRTVITREGLQIEAG